MMDLPVIESMFLIRAFENSVESYFSKGLLRGTTHSSIGQELAPAALGCLVDIEKDYVLATHRGHGYFLACTRQPYLLACEMMGRKDGPVYGAGGSQHIKYKNFYTNGITGGMAGVAAGVALSLKLAQTGAVCVCVLGDGGFNEGYVQEALNLAAVYGGPLLFLLENNQYAMSTKTARVMAGTIRERGEAYHIPYTHAGQDDPAQFCSTLKETLAKVRQSREPHFLEMDTFRLCGHSKSDNCDYMDEDERAARLLQDPIKAIAAGLGEQEAARLMAQAEEKARRAFEDAQHCDEISLPEFIRNTTAGRNANAH